MSLYVAATALALLAALLLGPVSTVMARARWVDRAPRAGCRGLAGDWSQCPPRRHGQWSQRRRRALPQRHPRGGGSARRRHCSGRPLAGIGLPDALGLTLAADLAFIFCCMLGAVTMRTVMTRRRHRRLVDLLSLRTLDTGASVLDHTTAVAYCVPGIRPRIVVSEGTIDLLDEDELDAVVAHERGHAHERHGLVMLPLAGVSKVFSIVPYARLAPRWLDSSKWQLTTMPSAGGILRVGLGPRLHGDSRRGTDLLLCGDRRMGVSQDATAARGKPEVGSRRRRRHRRGAAPPHVARSRAPGRLMPRFNAICPTDRRRGASGL